MKKENVFRSMGILAVLFLFPFLAYGQFEDHPYHFTGIQKIPTTPVKTQQRTGTCWCFATTSFVETEILRMGGPELNLS